MLKKLPDTLVLVFGILCVFVILTWLIPAGAFERTTQNGREVIVPGTFAYAQPKPQHITSIFTAPIKGFVSAAEIIGFIFLVGGAFGIITASGAISGGLQKIIQLSVARPQLRTVLIPAIIILFSLAGATFGMSEEVLVFVLITIPLAHALGYDTITGVAIPFIGAGAGFAGAFINPFTVGIAQGIAELPPFSGWGYRLVCWAAFTGVAVWYIMRYIHRQQQGTTSTESINQNQPEPVAFTPTRKLTLGLFGLALALLVVGVSSWGWYITEIAGLFLALGIFTALLNRMPAQEAVNAFTSGAADMITAGLVIALSKGILVVATEGKIIDTILYAVSSGAEDLPKALSIEVMFLMQSGLNFFLPSGSGQAALTMPIMAPLSDLLGITRQTAVLAFQFGDGLSNMIIPTSGVTMGVLAIGKIPYQKWVKWAGPLILLLFLTAMLLLLPPVLLFFYGPF
jgi:uncharacterized ion transporter superfamily protein YfcC